MDFFEHQSFVIQCGFSNFLSTWGYILGLDFDGTHLEKDLRNNKMIQDLFKIGVDRVQSEIQLKEQHVISNFNPTLIIPNNCLISVPKVFFLQAAEFSG